MRECMYQAEREKLSRDAKLPENAGMGAATYLRSVLNIKRGPEDQLNLTHFINELKMGGCGNDKSGVFCISGYCVPTRKQLKKFFQNNRLWKKVRENGEIFPNFVDPIGNIGLMTFESEKETPVEEKGIPVVEPEVKETPTPVTEYVSTDPSDPFGFPESEKKVREYNEPSTRVLVLLKFLYHNNWEFNGQKFMKLACVNTSQCGQILKEAVKLQILAKNGRRFEVLDSTILQEFYPECREQIKGEELMKLFNRRGRTLDDFRVHLRLMAIKPAPVENVHVEKPEVKETPVVKEKRSGMSVEEILRFHEQHKEQEKREVKETPVVSQSKPTIDVKSVNGETVTFESVTVSSPCGHGFELVKRDGHFYVYIL